MTICKSCGRPDTLHKGSSKKVHEWPRIQCAYPRSLYDPLLAAKQKGGR